VHLVRRLARLSLSELDSEERTELLLFRAAAVPEVSIFLEI